MIDGKLFDAISIIIVAIIAALPGSLLYFNSKKKLEMESTSEIVELAMSFVDPLKERVSVCEEENKRQNEHINLLENRINVLESDNKKLITGSTQLIHQVRSLGHFPVFELDDLSSSK